MIRVSYTVGGCVIINLVYFPKTGQVRLAQAAVLRHVSALRLRVITPNPLDDLSPSHQTGFLGNVATESIVVGLPTQLMLLEIWNSEQRF